MPELELTNQKIFNEMKRQADEVFFNDDVRSAYIFIRNMSRMLSSEEHSQVKKNQEYAEDYQRMIDMLSFICLGSLRDKEVVELFKNKLLSGFISPDIDLQQKLHAKFISMPAFIKRDELRKQIREALLENKQRLGLVEFIINNKNVISTIGNWLKKYNSLFGTGQVDTVKQNQFFTTDKDYKKIEEHEQMILRRIIGIYEYLKLSSQTAEGLEDPVMFNINGTHKLLRQGKWEDVKLPISLRKIVDDLFPTEGKEEHKKTKLTSYKNQDVVLEAKNILSSTAGKSPEVRSALHKSMQNSSITGVLGALLLLSQLRQLDTILSDDEKFRVLVEEDLKKSGQDDTVQGLKINPNAPQYLSRLLKVILQDKLALPENDALVFAQKLSQVLAMEGKKYANIVKNNKWNL